MCRKFLNKKWQQLRSVYFQIQNIKAVLRIRMDLRQGGHFQIERIINKHVYFQKWSHQRQYQYEVKYKGDSYLNTRWIPRQELDTHLVDQYERQFSNLRISEYEKGGDNIQNGSQDQDNYSSKELEGRRKQYNEKKQGKNVSVYQQQRPRMVKEFKNLQGLTNFRLSINTSIKKQQNHFIYGDRVQEVLSQIHNVYQKVNKNQQKSVTDSINNQKQPSKRDFCQERLVKKIEINLGDHEKNRQLLKTNNLKGMRNKQQETRRGLYMEMSELKQMQALKDRGVFIKIFMRVKWTDGTVSKVKMDYMNQYEPQMMVRYRDSRKTYWRDWKLKQKTLINKSNTQNHIAEYTQNAINEQVKYLQTPKTSRSESESNYETSSSSMAEMTHNQRNNKQVQGLTLQKAKNARIQYQSQQLNVKSIKRQHSLAQRQQISGANVIRKHIKPIEQEQVQNERQASNQNREYYKKIIYIGDKNRQIGEQNSLISIKNQIIEQLSSTHNASKLKQQQQQSKALVPKKQKTITQYFKKNQTQQNIDKPKSLIHDKPKSLIHDKPKFIAQAKPQYKLQDKSQYVIEDKSPYISRKSINQEALQMSKSKKLLETYGIDMKYGTDMLRTGNTVDKNRKQFIDSKHTLARRQSFLHRDQKSSVQRDYFVQREIRTLLQKEKIKSIIQKEKIKSIVQKENVNISLDNDNKNRKQVPKHIQVIEIDDD